jgi:hypothetical protein
MKYIAKAEELSKKLLENDFLIALLLLLRSRGGTEKLNYFSLSLAPIRLTHNATLEDSRNNLAITKTNNTHQTHNLSFTFSIMKFELSIVTVVALLAIQVLGEKADGGLRGNTQVRVRLYYNMLAVVFLSRSREFWLTELFCFLAWF